MNRWFTTLCRYPFSLVCILLIWYLCLNDFSGVEMSSVPLFPQADKVVHMVMYWGTCSVIGMEMLRAYGAIRKRWWCWWGIAAPLFMSALIEVLQAQTTYRSGDIYDFLANSLGVLLGTLSMRFLLYPLLKSSSHS